MMYADKENQLIYESYLTEGIVIKGEAEWREAYREWQLKVGNGIKNHEHEFGIWPVEELERHNKHIFQIIVKEARNRERSGEFGIVTGSDIEIYFSPVQRLDIGSGKERGPSGISVYEASVQANFERGYMIPTSHAVDDDHAPNEETSIEEIKEFWQGHAHEGDAYGRSDNELPFSR